MEIFNGTRQHVAPLRAKPFGWTLADPPVVTGFSFEYMDSPYWERVLSENMNLAFYIGGLYILVIFGLQKWMTNRPAFDLRVPLFVWNMTLGIFSIICFVRVLPGFMYTLQQPGGLYSSICHKINMDGPSLFWMLSFLMSKFVELGDTIFIVLRKRPLVFLQWYHHLVTMSVTMIVGPMMEPFIRWTVILNAFVHSFMYPYFALKGMGVKVSPIIANVITTLQFTQMLIAFAVNMSSLYFLRVAGYDCVRYSLSIKFFGVVYGTFILLFGKLFYDSVWQRRFKKKTV